MSRVKSVKPIDPKTAIMDAKTERKYMDTFRGRACECCGTNDDTVVPAHLNLNAGGTGFRVKGAVAALCSKCHDIADGRTAMGMAEGRRIWMRVCQKLLLDRAQHFKEENE